MRVSLFAFWFHASACGGKSRALREEPPAALRFIFDGSTTHAVSVDNNLRKPTRGACYNKAKRGKSARRRMMMANILIVEDDATIRQLTAMQLSLVGHQCLEAQDGVQMREQLAACTPDLALLDIMLPGEDGMMLGETLISRGIPVVFVTAKTGVEDRVRGLRLGAHDYILKPFEPAELLARVENILKRTRRAERLFTCRGLTVDFGARRILLHGETVAATAMEFDLLSMLISRRNIAVSREELLAQVWGYAYVGQTHTVDVHVQRLRSKIGAGFIETVYKFGYRFVQLEDEKE